MCGIYLYDTSFVSEPQKVFLEVRLGYMYHKVQYHISLLTYERYNIFVYKNNATKSFRRAHKCICYTGSTIQFICMLG